MLNEKGRKFHDKQIIQRQDLADNDKKKIIYYWQIINQYRRENMQALADGNNKQDPKSIPYNAITT